MRGYGFLIVLDNFDKVDDVEKLLWDIKDLMLKILRPSGLILISTGRHDLFDLVGERLYSRLRVETLEFQPYTAEKLYEILESRIKEAYGKRVADEDALRLISEFVAVNGGSARYAINIFLRACEIAQQGELERIDSTIVRETLDKEKLDLVLTELHEMREESPRMFEVLKIIVESSAEKGKTYTGSVFDSVKSKGLSVSQRSVGYYLNDLERKGFIQMKKVRRSRGYSREIKPCISSQLVSS